MSVSLQQVGKWGFHVGRHRSKMRHGQFSKWALEESWAQMTQWSLGWMHHFQIRPLKIRPYMSPMMSRKALLT